MADSLDDPGVLESPYARVQIADDGGQLAVTWHIPEPEENLATVSATVAAYAERAMEMAPGIAPILGYMAEAGDDIQLSHMLMSMDHMRPAPGYLPLSAAVGRRGEPAASDLRTRLGYLEDVTAAVDTMMTFMHLSCAGITTECFYVAPANDGAGAQRVVLSTAAVVVQRVKRWLRLRNATEPAQMASLWRDTAATAPELLASLFDSSGGGGGGDGGGLALQPSAGGAAEAWSLGALALEVLTGKPALMHVLPGGVAADPKAINLPALQHLAGLLAQRGRSAPTEAGLPDLAALYPVAGLAPEHAGAIQVALPALTIAISTCLAQAGNRPRVSRLRELFQRMHYGVAMAVSGGSHTPGFAVPPAESGGEAGWGLEDDSVPEAPAAVLRLVRQRSSAEPSTAPPATLLLARTPSTVFECPICFGGEMPKTDQVVLCDAGHVMCCTCALRTLRNLLTADATSVPCPLCSHGPVLLGAAGGAGASPNVATGGAGGGDTPWIAEAAVMRVRTWSVAAHTAGRLDDDVRPLSTDEVARYERIMISAALNSSKDGRERTVRCPNSECCAMFMAELPADRKPAAVQCMACRTQMCILCSGDWKKTTHKGKSCEAAAAVLALQSGPGFSELFAELGDTFKQCPRCGSGISHYRGHDCHHIKPPAGPNGGCPGCHTHFCYTCLTILPPEGPHACPKGCPRFCAPECDCVVCPECRPSQPCPNCSGRCPACQGETREQAARRVAEGDAARRAKIAAGWCGPRRSAATGETLPSRPGAEVAQPAAAPAAAPAPPAVGTGHAGTWRGAATHYWCSTAGDREGPLCTHGSGIITRQHWSCCGAASQSDNCTAVVAAHAGYWRGPGRSRWCSLANDLDGGLCTHDAGIVQDVHWSCCGARSENAPCTRPRPAAAPTAAAPAAAAAAAAAPRAPGPAPGPGGRAHTGYWRSTHRNRWCSLPTDRDGDLCTHSGSIVQAAHWSCCGVRTETQECAGNANTAPAPPVVVAPAPAAARTAARVAAPAPPFVYAAAPARAPSPAPAAGRHVGYWRSESRSRWCSLATDTDGDLCTHAGGVIRAAHWSCCGVKVQAGACTCAPVAAPPPVAAAPAPAPAPAAAAAPAPAPPAAVARNPGGHTGYWRGRGASKWCSLPNDSDGVLCSHRDRQNRVSVIAAEHWSCCGATGRDARCTQAAAAPAPAAVAAPPPAPTAPTVRAHSGSWRDADCPKWCSLPNDVDGTVCAHPGGIIKAVHWSCCGARRREDGCTATGTGAQQR